MTIKIYELKLLSSTTLVCCAVKDSIVLTFESVLEILKCDPLSNESY